MRSKLKAILSTTVISLAVISSAYANGSESNFFDRGDANQWSGPQNERWGKAQRGNDFIDFHREIWKSTIDVEVQHVLSTNTWYLRISDTDKKDPKVSFKTITLLQNDKSFVLQPETDIPTSSSKWIDSSDLWYKLSPDIIEALSSNTKGWKLEAALDNGKQFKHNLNDLANGIAGLVHHPENFLPYGPSFSYYFPGKSAKDVRAAFLYNLVERDENSKVTDAMDLDGYCIGKDLDNASFYRGYSDDNTNHGYAAFKEAAGGTWVDLDFLTYRIIAVKNGYFTSYTNVVDNRVKDSFVNNAIHSVQKSYYEMEEHPDYGITLAGGLTKNNPKVESVDIDNHPELANVSKGDWILTINDCDVTGKNYYVQYAFDFAPANTVLHIKFKNDKTGEYTVDVKPIMKPQEKPNDFSYASYILPQKKNKNFTEGTAYVGVGAIPEIEVFDPYSTEENHIISPRIHAIAKAIGAYRY